MKEDNKVSTKVESKMIRSDNKVKILSSTKLGHIRAEHKRRLELWKSQNLTKEQIQDKLIILETEDALILGMLREDLQTQLASLSVKSGGGITTAKTLYRNKFDELTDNFLYAINNSKDALVSSSLSALLNYDHEYQSITGIQQTDRTDWRGLIMLKEHINTPNNLVRHLGGWTDPSARDQYSNGRRTPVSKATGYTLEQELPIFTGKLPRPRKARKPKS